MAAELKRLVLRSRPRVERTLGGWRLVALDGTQFSLTDTPQITATTLQSPDAARARAFAKLTTAVLLEVGLHNPLAAAIGRHGESEWALAQRLLASAEAGRVARRLLVRGRRLCRPRAGACARVGSHFLLRARIDQAAG